MARTRSTPFNAADPTAFDHDGDGAPGGSLPAVSAAVLLAPHGGRRRGDVVRGAVGDLIASGAARQAHDRDLAVAGPNVFDL